MEQRLEQRPAERQIRSAATRALTALLAILLAAAVIVPLTVHFVRRAEARDILRLSKTLELAIFAAASEQRALGLSVADPDDPHGFAPGMEERVRKLSGCAGEILLLEWDAATGQANRMLYREGDYQAEFNRETETPWRIVRLTPMIPAS